jgi:hypothetical protein
MPSPFGSYRQVNQFPEFFSSITDPSFGSAVAVSKDLVVVGASGANDHTGAAYIFERLFFGTADYGEGIKLVVTGVSKHDEFGRAVAVTADGVVAVGAPHTFADLNSPSGSVYLFEKSGDVYRQISKLMASDGAGKVNWFGLAVATAGNDTVVVGAPLVDSVYMFERGSDGKLVPERKLVPADATSTLKRFGISLAATEDRLAVGAHLEDGNASGSVYVFERSAPGLFVQASKLVTTDATANPYFGASVAVSRNVVAIGAPDYVNGLDGNLGSAYVYVRDCNQTYVQASKLTADRVDDTFGCAVAVNNGIVVVGSSNEDSPDQQFVNSGAAYVLEI